MPTPKEIQAVQEKILSFYASHKRQLPWRETCDPYAILVAEVMLQQTQVSRVIPFYKKWLAKWPSAQSLAQASRKEVLQAWLGLGYNSRALRLHAIAKHATKHYRGDILATIRKEKLPGIGLYTRNAVLIFSANEDVVAVDTNIRRILLHEFQLPHDLPARELQTLASQCLPRGQSRNWHNALMDYGSAILTAKKTGIPPTTTQSCFEGSDRQLRSTILRSLLHAPATLHELKAVEPDTSRLQRILDALVKENIIWYQQETYMVRE